jgi:hypothetical protein
MNEAHNIVPYAKGRKKRVLHHVFPVFSVTCRGCTFDLRFIAPSQTFLHFFQCRLLSLLFFSFPIISKAKATRKSCDHDAPK